jgi:hypothetical protein
MKREEKLKELTERQKAMQAAPGGITSGGQVAEWMGLVAAVEQLGQLPEGSEVSYDPATNRWTGTAPKPASQPITLPDPTQPSQPAPAGIAGPSDTDVARALRNLADLLDARYT